MEDIRKFAKEKLDLTEEDVINWIKKHKSRVIVNAVAFGVQFLVIFWFLTGADFNERNLFVRLLVVLSLCVLMVSSELIRYSDVLLQKYGYISDENVDNSGNDCPTPSGRRASTTEVTKKSVPVSSKGSSSSSQSKPPVKKPPWKPV